MPTIRQLEEQGRALLEDQKKLVDDPRPWSTKRAEYDKREADIKAVLEQHKALKAVDRRGFAYLEGDDPSDRSRSLRGLHAGIAAAGHQPIPTPQLDLADADAKELYDAAVSHKSLAVTIKAADTSATVTPALIPDYRLPPVTARREPTRVLSLLPTFATNNAAVTWYSTTGTTAAAPVAEGAAKPLSTIAYVAQTTSATKVAHYTEVSDETLADFQGFLAVLESDMVAGLIKAENAELLNATVAGASKWPGLLNTSGILTLAKGAESDLDTISMGFDALRVGTSFAEPDGLIIHPTTWGIVRRLKDSNGRYYLTPDPTQDTSLTLWNVPVVLTTQIAVGTALLGAFAESVAVYVREGIRVDVANQGPQFTTNTTLCRAEERLIQTVVRPTGLVKITGLI